MGNTRIVTWALASAALLPGMVAAQTATQTQSVGTISTYNYAYDGRRNDAYQTRITTTVDGATFLYDQLFYGQLTDAQGQAGLAEAGAVRAVAVHGAPGVIVWSGAELIDSYEELIDSFTDISITTLAPTFITTVQTTAGDAPNNVVYTGDRGGCFDTGVSGATNYAPFDGAFANCDTYEEAIVAPGTINTNTHTSTIIETLETWFTNYDYVNFAHYQLTGQMVLIGTVHPGVQTGLFESGARFSGRLLDAPVPETGGRAWIEGHDGHSESRSEGSVVGNRRSMSGMTGGLVLAANDHWRFGLGVDRTDYGIDVVGAPEEADLDLTQFGAHVGYDAGRWFANLAVSHARGEADTRHGNASMGGVSTAKYDIALNATAMEFGYRLQARDWQVVPQAGIEWVEAKTDDFSEQGGIALVADRYSAERSRAWAGLEVGRQWQWADQRSLAISMRARLLSVLSGEDRLLPVALATARNEALAITGPDENSTGGELGFAAILGLGGRVSLYLAAQARRNGDDEAHGVQAGVQFGW